MWVKWFSLVSTSSKFNGFGSTEQSLHSCAIGITKVVKLNPCLLDQHIHLTILFLFKSRKSNKVKEDAKFFGLKRFLLLISVCFVKKAPAPQLEPSLSSSFIPYLLDSPTFHSNQSKELFIYWSKFLLHGHVMAWSNSTACLAKKSVTS